jgi:hypothetical protein
MQVKQEWQASQSGLQAALNLHQMVRRAQATLIQKVKPIYRVQASSRMHQVIAAST